MKITTTFIEGLFIIQPNVFEDSRGYFFESYNHVLFEKMGVKTIFLQDNESRSQKAVVRGLHFQHPPFAQAKLVRVIKGAVKDVVVDIRKNSTTYGKHFEIELTEKNKTMFYIPEGFAHGFRTLQKDTIFFYKCSQIYHKEAEDTILWNDKSLNINWGIENPVLSEKDRNAKPFSELKSLF